MPPSITQPGEHLLCKQAEIQSKSLFWLRFRISDQAKYVPKMFLLRWAAQIDQWCVPRCSPQPKAGMAYSLRRCFWAFATLRLTEVNLLANSTILRCRCRRSGLFRSRGLQAENE